MGSNARLPKGIAMADLKGHVFGFLHDYKLQWRLFRSDLLSLI